MANAPGVTGVSALPPRGRPAFVNASLGGPHARLLIVVAGVRQDVTALTVQVAGSPSLRLIPVQSMGRRWVGMVIPGKLQITNIIAYGTAGELGHTVPYSPDPFVGINNHHLAGSGPPRPGPDRCPAAVPRGRAWGAVPCRRADPLPHRSLGTVCRHRGNRHAGDLPG
jgi:hypothetical protein